MGTILFFPLFVPVTEDLPSQVDRHWPNSSFSSSPLLMPGVEGDDENRGAGASGLACEEPGFFLWAPGFSP